MGDLSLKEQSSWNRSNYQTISNDTDSEDEITQLRDVSVRQGKLHGIKMRLFPMGFKYEFVQIMKIAIPIMVTNILQFTILTESVIICGHLTKLELDGVALAISMINAFGLGINVGLTTACDTLFSQSYGSPNKKRLGMFLQKSVMVLSLCPIVLWCVHINVEPIFIALGQNPDVARLAAIFMRNCLPGILFHLNYTILMRYMQNQDRVYPPIFIALLGNVFNIVSQYICVYVLNYGFEASSICQATAYFLQWLAALSYIICSKLYVKTWDGWTAEALFDWWPFLTLALAGVGHLAFEIICYEVMTFLAGVMGDVELGAQSILFQTEATISMIPVSVSIASNIRVGQYLGANNPQGARGVFNVGLCTSVITGATLAIFLTAGKDILPRIFTNEEDIISLTAIAFPAVAALAFIQSNSIVCGGVMRGCGKQKVGAFLVFLGFYILGLPIGVSLGFVAKMGVLGLWVGLLVGVSVAFMGYLIVLNRQDWEEQAKKAAQRLAGRETIPENDSFVDEHTAILGNRHIRTPSEPYGPSIVKSMLPPKKDNISREEIYAKLRLRLATVFFVVLLFVGSVFIHVYIPREWYVPNRPVNASTIAPAYNYTKTWYTTVSV